MHIYVKSTTTRYKQASYFSKIVYANNANICYIVSVKVQFFCLPIGQNRTRTGPQNVMFGNRSAIYLPVNNKMGAIRMRVNHEVPKFIF
jgi:hypothetical protein